MKLNLINKVLLLSVILITPIIEAGVPQMINYQALLSDPGGEPVTDGIHLIKFKIYGSSTFSDSLWSSGFRGVNVVNGLFSYILGDSIPLPGNLFQSDSSTYLGIQIGGDTEISPRTRLISNGYAFHSLRSDTGIVALSVVDNSINSAKIQDASISFDDIGDNGANEGQIIKYVGGSWIPSDEQNNGWIDNGATISLSDTTDAVGIGTASPAEKLHVAIGRLLMGSSSWLRNPLHPGDIIFDNGAAVDLPGIKFYYADNKNFGIDYFAAASEGLRFTEDLDEGGGITRMIIRNGGNVGIGILNPSEQLEVANNIKVGGTVQIGEVPTGYVLPSQDGTAGQVITTDGAGQANWTTPAGGGTGVVPIGAIVAWSKSLAGVPQILPDNFVECNGQTISDILSPLDGQIIPDLNGNFGIQRFLRGSTGSGVTGGSDAHVHALYVTGANSETGGVFHITNTNTDQRSSLPSYYSVVWIMRVN